MWESLQQKLDELRAQVRTLSMYADTLETSDFVSENGMDVTDQKIRETRDLISSLQEEIDALEQQSPPTPRK